MKLLFGCRSRGHANNIKQNTERNEHQQDDKRNNIIHLRKRFVREIGHGNRDEKTQRRNRKYPFPID